MCWSFPGKGALFQGLDLHLSTDEVLVILGPNGCGKTTLLHILAGLERPGEGSVSFPALQSKRARWGFVLQDYRASLFPWRTVEGNLRLVPGSSRATIEEALHTFDLWDHRRAFPYELSGGMMQRAALARALSGTVDALLLDEPFSAQDVPASLVYAEKLTAWMSSRRVPAVVVTHHLENAFLLGDRFCVLAPDPPTRVLRVLEIPLPKPRSAETLHHPLCARLREDVLDYFTGKPEKATLPR